jgi:hypothetical protein
MEWERKREGKGERGKGGEEGVKKYRGDASHDIVKPVVQGSQN